MTKIAIFASGNGSNAENIIHHFSKSDNIDISLVLSNKKDAFVLTRAEKLGVPAFVFSKDEFNEGFKIIEILQRFNIDFIVLAGFLLKVSPMIISMYPQRIINIHPALLPKYGGKGMYGSYVHEAVKNAKEIETGITIHYINENYDEGDIIFQDRCALIDTDTPEDIARKVQELEFRHFPKIIDGLLKNNVK